MLLLEYHPKTETEAVSEENAVPSEDESEDTFDNDLLQRTCCQCGFNFFQEKASTLMCLCWNCRTPKEETPSMENLPVQVFPSFMLSVN